MDAVQAATAKKEDLKLEVCGYLEKEGVEQSMMAKICKSIAEDATGIMVSYNSLRGFGKRHHDVVRSWIDRYAEIDAAIACAQDEAYEQSAEYQQMAGALEREAHDYGYDATPEGRAALAKLNSM